MAELADAQDLKSCGTNLPYRFDSGRRHSESSIKYVRVAQLDRAFGYGPKGREFESSHARDSPCKIIILQGLIFLFILVFLIIDSLLFNI